jgi:CubicO group peptidase (beta-lactamase class C family)
VPDLSFGGDFDEPITVAHLLTHTSGLDEQNLARYVDLGDADASVRAYLLATMPPRIRPPGLVYQYSNHGMALAGVAAEEVAGAPFPDLLDELVFEPLGMTRSSMHLDAPRGARGYVDRDGTLVPQTPHYVRTAYSGMLVSTAEDQLRMMAALLERHTLAPSTIDGLSSRRFSHDEISSGTAFATFEDRWTGTSYYWHEGQTNGFYAGFYIVPERGLGLFVAYNRHRGALARTLRYGLLNRVMGPATLETDLTDSGTPLATLAPRVEGTYRYVRHAHATPELIVSSMLGRAGELQVAAEDDGQLRIGRARFVPAGDLLFVEPETGAVNGFLAGARGDAEYLYYQRSAFERIPFFAREEVRDGWIGLSLLLYGLTLTAWIVLGLVRRLRRRDADARTRARWLQLPGIVAQVLFLAGLVIVVNQFRGDAIFRMLFAWPLWMKIVFVIPWLAVLLLPVQLVATSIACRAAEVRWFERMHHGLLAAFALLFAASAWTWGLL